MSRHARMSANSRPIHKHTYPHVQQHTTEVKNVSRIHVVMISGYVRHSKYLRLCELENSPRTHTLVPSFSACSSSRVLICSPTTPTVRMASHARPPPILKSKTLHRLRRKHKFRIAEWCMAGTVAFEHVDPNCTDG